MIAEQFETNEKEIEHENSNSAMIDDRYLIYEDIPRHDSNSKTTANMVLETASILLLEPFIVECIKEWNAIWRKRYSSHT
jgi:hypothetical protein